jgi:integrase
VRLLLTSIHTIIWLASLDATQKHYLFYRGDDASKPYESSAWTHVIKSLFKRHSGVPLAPKQLRASFATFLKSGNHNDATLRSAAVALRHSSKTQDSAAYNKGKGDRLTAAAVKVAEDFAATFKVGQPRGKARA